MCDEVDAGEVLFLQPAAQDRHRVGHDVDAAGLYVGLPLRVGDRPVHDMARAAEDRLGHRLDHVDVEPLELAVERVQEAEVVGVLVDAGDEVAALADVLHPGSGHPRRARQRRQARRVRIALGDRGGGRVRLGSRLVSGRGRRVTRRSLGRVRCRRGGTPRQRGRGEYAGRERGGCERGDPANDGAARRAARHRYSVSRRLMPKAQPAAMISAPTASPYSRPV